ncbi:MAG: citrate synthase, partial [Proteobacteria bacterium]|nr:citrate synthase [Pseudomonadota bacterium]
MSQDAYRLISPSGKETELPVLSGTAGPDVLDISKLYAQQGVFTYDPGFAATGSCSSNITFIDGEEGLLMYRGYPVEQLAKSSSFLEVSYLLLHGELPTGDELADFESTIRRHTMLNEGMLSFFKGFRYDAHPMAMLSAVVGSMSAYYHDKLDASNPQHRDIFAHRILAKLPTIAAAAYKLNCGQPFIYPRNDLNYCENLLQMFFAVPAEPYEIDQVAAEAIDLLFILHADHEQNCSTSTVRMAGSSGANPYSAVAAGISALWGPAHGGANEAVLAMLEEIGDVSQIGKYVDKAKDKNDPFRLMGFGHRVYKNFDPRATIIRKMAHKILGRLGRVDTPLYDLALALEEVALKDEYFIEKRLYPNVDF